MNYAQAKRRAELLLDDMIPHCERVAIAGSIRRKKPDGTGTCSSFEFASHCMRVCLIDIEE